MFGECQCFSAWKLISYLMLLNAFVQPSPPPPPTPHTGFTLCTSRLKFTRNSFKELEGAAAQILGNFTWKQDVCYVDLGQLMALSHHRSDKVCCISTGGKTPQMSKLITIYCCLEKLLGYQFFCPFFLSIYFTLERGLFVMLKIIVPIGYLFSILQDADKTRS